MTNEVQNAVDALDNPADAAATSDIDIILNGTVVAEEKNLDPKGFAPHFMAAVLAHAGGAEVEIVVHNPVVFNLMTRDGLDAQPDERFKVTLKSAA